MEATRQAGIKLNYNKCIIKTKSCSFFGNVYTPAGVKTDPKKVEAIKKMEAPRNKQTVAELPRYGDLFRSICSKCFRYDIQHEENSSKRMLLFQWTETHEADFQKLKEVFTSQECLAYFDQKKDIFFAG